MQELITLKKINIIDLLDQIEETPTDEFYDELALNSHVDDDELSSSEEGFMVGYLNA